jgi:hypothetical protein
MGSPFNHLKSSGFRDTPSKHFHCGRANTIKLLIMLFAIGIIAVGNPGCSRGKSDPRPTDKAQALDSHERMLKLLSLIKDQTPDKNPYFGDADLRRVRDQLNTLPADAPERYRIDLNATAGSLELRLGETQKAIEHLLSAYTLATKARRELPAKDMEMIVFRLAVAYLRLGETENCVHCRTGESCLLPIRGSGVHVQQSGSRKAIEYLQILLSRAPDHIVARWLMNIAYMTVGEYPQQVPKKFLIPPSAFDSQEEFPRFTNVATEMGLDTFSLSGGCIVDDFDNDGYLDIVVSSYHTSGQLRYFCNNGNGTFTERTEEAGFLGLFGGLNLLQADYDNDNDLDILVLRGAWLNESGQHPNSLLRNDGRGRFRDVTFPAGLGEQHFPTQTAAWGDYDNDGDLDLYVGNEGYPSQLFENQGNGTFREVASRSGVINRGYTKGVVWGDYNADRYPDLYVSNLGQPNRLYRNNKDGTFTDVAEDAGVEDPKRSFPCWFWDFNNDGALDLFVSAYANDISVFNADFLGLPHKGEVNHLYQGDGRGGFQEVAGSLRIGRVTESMGCNFGDLDNDGFPDFYLGTGTPEYEALIPNLMLHNQRGKGFSDVSAAGGFSHLQKGHAVAFADLDNDGDQDIFTELGGAFPGDAFINALFENPGFNHHWISVKLIGKQSNRSAIGTRIHVQFNDAGTKRSVYQWVNSGGSFGAKPLRREIGLGKATTIESIEIFWPKTGRIQRFHSIPVDQFIEITEGDNDYRKLPLNAAKFVRKIE